MSDPYRPPQPGEHIPPPAYQGASDIPPDSPYHYSPTPKRDNRGLMGGVISAAFAIWAVVKYGLVFLIKIPALLTLGSALVSFGAYALLRGPEFAAALIVMLFVHEMGHVVEIRRQGHPTRLPGVACLEWPLMGSVVLVLTYVFGAAMFATGLYLIGRKQFPWWLKQGWLWPLTNVTPRVAVLQGWAGIGFGTSVMAMGLGALIQGVFGGLLVTVGIAAYIAGLLLYGYSTYVSRRARVDG